MQDIPLFKKLNFTLRKTINMINPNISYTMRSICILLTYECNLRCKMCPVWGENGFAYKLDEQELKTTLTVDELKEVIDGLTFYNPIIILSGGEPLFYKEWDNIAKYVKQKKMRIVMQTNGMLLKENNEKIVEYIDSLSVSIDGPADVHNKIRGCNNSFERIIDGIRKIDELKKRRGQKLPSIDINFTITSLNYDKLVEFTHLMNDMEIEINSITFMHLFFIHKEAFNYHNMHYHNILNLDKTIYGFEILPDIDSEVLHIQIQHIKENKYKFATYFEPEMNKEQIRKYYDITSPLKDIDVQGRCTTPWSEAMLLPDGSLLNCICNVIGNIKEDNIRNLWNNNMAAKIRNIIRKNNTLPICKTCRFRYM